MRPRVKVMQDQFRLTPSGPITIPTRTIKCHVPGCKLSGKRPHFHRNNYQNRQEPIWSRMTLATS